MSASRFTLSPGFSVAKVVTCQVCGMISTPNRPPSLVHARHRQRHAVDADRALLAQELAPAARRTSIRMRQPSPSCVTERTIAQAIDVAETIWPPSSSPSCSERSRLTCVPALPARRASCATASPGWPRPSTTCRMPGICVADSTTVRQQPDAAPTRRSPEPTPDRRCSTVEARAAPLASSTAAHRGRHR